MNHAVRFFATFETDDDAGVDPAGYVREFMIGASALLHDLTDTIPGIREETVEVQYAAFVEGSEIYNAIQRARDAQQQERMLPILEEN